MKKLIIFGIKDFAQLAHYYFTNDSSYEVVAFSLTTKYIGRETSLEGLPIVPFETIERVYSPKEYAFFVPMSPSNMNKDREKIYMQTKEKGYEIVSYVSSRATIFDNVKVGENCFILEDNTVQPFVKIGNNVILWSGNHIGHHSEIEDHVFVSSHVVLCGHTKIEPYCFLGVNSTVKENTTLKQGTFVSMSSAITRDTEQWGYYRGNPALKQQKSSLEL
jgi:sugar O-acyltransferase (sialic acid O-acetyltransferase NeuD family)